MPKKNYKILIEQDEDGYFVASVPSLPGCYTQAKNLTSLKFRVREAISLCLDEANRNPSYRSRIKNLAYEPAFVGIEMIEL